MDATCTIQDSIHVFSLVHKYVSRILGTYHDSAVYFVYIPECSGICNKIKYDKNNKQQYGVDF